MNFHLSIIVASYSSMKSQDVEKMKFFEFFFRKTTPHREIIRILFWKFSSRHQSTCCVQILWNLADGKSVKLCVIYLTKNKISPGSPALATAQMAPKICEGQPPTMYSECSRFHPKRFTFGSVISKCMNTVRARSKVNPTFGWSIASSRIIIFLSVLWHSWVGDMRTIHHVNTALKAPVSTHGEPSLTSNNSD